MIRNINNRYIREKYWDIVNNARNKPCIDCGIVLPSECMEFDHTRGKKDFEVAGFVRIGAGKKRILDEIAKCDIRCPNCHKLRHYKENYKTGRYIQPIKREIDDNIQQLLEIFS